MSEKLLRQASRQTLIEMILRQQETLRDQEALIESLAAQVKSLKTQLEELKQPAKTPENSSKPPSSGYKGNRPQRERKKGKQGRVGKSRKRVVPDVVIECHVEQCGDCGADLSGLPQRLLGSSQVGEIPPVEPVVVEARRYGCICPHCGVRQSAAYPSGMEPERVFGRRLEGVVTYLHEIHHLSYQRLQTVLKVLYGLTVSAGALVNMVERTSKALKPTTEAILRQIRGSPVVGSDETSARIAGRNHWQWVFVTETATYHVIASSRGSKVIAEVMGDAIPLVWVSDMWSAQLVAKTKQRQLCLAHQLRDLQYAIDADGSAWAWRMQQLFRRSIRLGKQRGDLPAKRFELAVQQVDASLDDLLKQRARGPEAQRLRERYHLHRQSLLVFLHVPGVPPDNNASERALRNSVIHRKVIGGFRSQWGADAHAIVASVVDTARKRGDDVFDTLLSHLGPATPIVSAASV
jgi:transposase